MLTSVQWYSLIITTENIECFDSDNDGFGDPGHSDNSCSPDNCPGSYNPDQGDSDAGAVGDACDYKCGGTNNDGVVNILDIVLLINNIYKGGANPVYPASTDVNSDGFKNVLDIVHLINNIYKGGPVPY